MLINDPIHLKNFTTYVKQLPFNQDTIKVILNTSDIGKNPMFYLEYASLFQNSFEIEDAKNKVTSLNIAGYLCYNYSLLLDASLDKDAKHNTLILSGIYLEEAIKILTNLFQLDNFFWGLWNLRKQEVFEASKAGKKMFHNGSFSMAEYEQLCDNKSALGKIALDSLFTLNNKTATQNYTRLLESHKYFSVGFQINDDISDLIEDYENKDFNFAYYKFVIEKNRIVNDINEVKKLLYISGEAVELYNLSLSYFEKALTIAKEVGQNTWLEAITGKIKETESAINSIEEYLEIINTKVSLKQNAIAINSFDYLFDQNTIIGKGLHYLTKEWEKDYPEVKHIMILSNREGFENNKKLHITDIFQRGILTNNLIDIAQNYKIDLSKIINYEINYLVQNRNKSDAGCWSYFPSVKEIAPDADDLGQMIQIFKKYDTNKIITDYCTLGIGILTNDCYNKKTGGIQTWIIPKENPSEIQKLQKYFNDTKWGSGPDVDVMANFLYALCLYDFKKYKEVIENGTSYIYTQIEEGSFWNSRWYYGWQYGTMICVRLTLELLKHNDKLEGVYSNNLQKIKQYIIEYQNNDGGWANQFKASSDPLNTALALSTLLLFDKSYYNNDVLEKGIAFLENTQSVDGSWEAIPFIKPKLNEPYKSAGITTSYILNTLTTYYGKHFAH
jgi:squalene-hopene/tetraprenyl-beta-curcumene cyclase